MPDPFDGFLGEVSEPAPPRRWHPRSMNPDDPYLLLDEADWFTFAADLEDTKGTRVQVREIVARPARGFHEEVDGDLEYHVYGFPYLKGGHTLGKRPALHIPIKAGQIPHHIKERIDAQWPPT